MFLIFFERKLRAEMLSDPVTHKYGPDIAKALRSAISGAGSDWKSLMGRLKADHLSPREAGAVAAVWIGRHDQHVLNDDLREAMDFSSEVLRSSLKASMRLDGDFNIDEAMRREGLLDARPPRAG